MRHYNKASKTLLITDVVQRVSVDAPPVCLVNPQPLLVRAMAAPGEVPPNNQEAWRVGWAKTAGRPIADFLLLLRMRRAKIIASAWG